MSETKRIPRTKETGLAILCFVVGAFNIYASVSVNPTGSVPLLGISMLGLGMFWLSGGLTGHGSL